MTPTAAASPTWPVIVKHDDNDELIYVASFQQWHADTALSAFPYQHSDFLIDALGEVFELYYDQNRKEVALKAINIKISLARFSELVQRHLTVHAQSGDNKIAITDYAHGFELVASTDDLP